MSHDVIDYGKLVDEAMHIIVSKVLKDAELKGLPGEHHFFISFLTKHPGVKISRNLKERYPREMTIVLQYQFQDLAVTKDGFAVALSFNGQKENIYIPQEAITTFADPSVQFGLQFRDTDFEVSDQDDITIEVDEEDGFDIKRSNAIIAQPTVHARKENNVITLDNFRKKKF